MRSRKEKVPEGLLSFLSVIGPDSPGICLHAKVSLKSVRDRDEPTGDHILMSEKGVIESARIVTSGKIKARLSAVKDNINFWNELHQLGLAEFRSVRKGATWTFSNCVFAIRELEADLTELHLLVAGRQMAYRWFFGLQPEEPARMCWNRIFQLWPHEWRGDSYQQIAPSVPKVSLDVVEHAMPSQMSELARLAHIGEIAEARYGKGTQNAHHAHMQKVEEEIAAAKRFKREQEAIPDLTPNELAHDFLAMLPPGDTATVSFDQRPVYEPQPADDVRGAPAPGSANAPNGEKKRGPGRDKLDRAEEIYRLAKAQEAMEKKTEAREKTGKEIAKEIQWRPGWDLKGVKLLEDARHRLKRVVDAKDEATLNEIAEFRKEKKTIRYPLFHSLHA